MSILRIIIRFLIIAVAIGLLIFLSVSLFRLIPAGINQLASATVSLGKKNSLQQATTTQATTTQNNPTIAPVTSDGLTGTYDTQGDIVILDEKTSRTSSTKSTTGQTTYTAPRTVARYYTIYNPTQYIPNRGKNLKVTFTSIGVIRNGQYIQTNSFNTTDTVSMRFTILNEDYSSTGTWGMRVEMPAAAGADKVKVLNNLASISGESSYTGEVRFDGIDLSQGVPVIRIYLDIYNEVAESNENDNTLAVELRNVTNTYYNNNYYNNTYPDSNYYHNCFNGTYYYTCNGNNWYDSGYNNGNNNTAPNLYISSVEFGKIVNGTFYSQTTFNYGERVIVRARIRNNGGYVNNYWSTRLNIYDANNFNRDISNGNQSPITSNGETTVTYEIDNLTRGSNRITLYADSQNNISESNEYDNSTQYTIQVN